MRCLLALGFLAWAGRAHAQEAGATIVLGAPAAAVPVLETPAPADCLCPPVAAPKPAEGADISLLGGGKLKLFGQFSAIASASATRPFPAGGPLFLLPPSAAGNRTNTFDLHARQTGFGAMFSGPEIMGLTPGAYFLGFVQNDNLTSDAYGFLPFNAYGELKNEQWRIAAGLQRDVFNPVNPTMISLLNLYGSGNTGSFRGQFRVERFLKPGDELQITLQAALAEPVASVVSNNRVIEDDGWPNVEVRVALGAGARQEYAGGRKLRPLEFGVSGLVGAMRSSGVTAPAPGVPTRAAISVWALGADVQAPLTERFGLAGEFFTGSGIGEYNGGVSQTFGSGLRAIRATGGFAEGYFHFDDQWHLHGGYGLDAPRLGDLAPGQFARNETFFANLVWDLSKALQLSFEADYRRTKYVGLRTGSGVVFLSQMLWKF